MYTNYRLIKKDLGFSVDIDSNYFAVGNPSLDTYLENNPSEMYEGDTYIYKKNIDTYKYYKTLRRKIYFNPFYDVVNYDDINVVESDFGRSVSVYENYVAISATSGKFFIPSSSLILNSQSFYYNIHNSNVFEYTHPIDSYDVIEIYDLNSNSDNPIHYVNWKMVEDSSSFETGVNSFGMCVSMNENFLIVGDPYTRLNPYGIYRGSVHIFSGSVKTGYVYHRTITSSYADNDIEFGYSVKIDKRYNKIVVGNGNIYSGSSNVYLYECINGDWVETQIFKPKKYIEKLEYSEYYPNTTTFNELDCFGNSVCIYCKSDDDVTVAVGASFDRSVVGYNSNVSYNNGAVYVYEKINCILTTGSISVSSSYYQQTRLSGNKLGFRNNRLGHSVSIYDNHIVASAPRIYTEQSSSYIQNTFYQSFIDEEKMHDGYYQGMVYIYEKSGSKWDICSYYKPRKVYGIPHKFFGYSTAIYESNILLGCPITLIDNNRFILVNNGRNNVNKHLQGNFNLININEYKQQHHVGNVFYKNGIIVISTSGSVFDDIFENKQNDFLLYDLKFENTQRLYQKEYICTINIGEFNRSTNPTSYYYYPSVTFDINKNGKFDFNDCDMLLRFLCKYSYKHERWWEVLNISQYNMSFDDKVEYSRFMYYLDIEQLSLFDSRFDDEMMLDFINRYMAILDINDDGIADKNDMYLLWKYFVNTLRLDNFMQYITRNSFKKRRSYDSVISYLHEMCGKYSKPMSLSGFIESKRMELGYTYDITKTSSLCPYITTIGLYQETSLVAVAKLGTPIKNTGDFPINFVVRMDY